MSRAGFLLFPTMILIALLWLPFGFHMGGLIEEWGLLEVYEKVGPIFFAGADSLMPQHQIRPLMTTPWALAYMIDPDSWWPWHVELALSLLIKGASMSWLALYLTGSRKWSAVAGLLFIVWPADTMQMAFRAVNVGLSAGLAPLSAALFIAAYHTASGARRALLSLLGGACIVVGSWMYELTLLLAPLPFLVIYAKDGFSSALDRMMRCYRVTLFWLAAVTINVCYILHALLTAKETYQQDVTGDRAHLLASLESNAPMLFTRGFARSLADGWLDAARIIAHDFPSHWYFLVLAGMFLAIIFFSGRRQPAAGATHAVRIAIVGAIALALGYAPFLVATSHLAISQRTFMFAAAGACLIFLACLTAIDRRSPATAIIASVVLLTLGSAQQLYQFREYTENYEHQRKALRAIVEQAPDLPAGKTLVVLDDSGSLNHTWMQSLTLRGALTYLYGRTAGTAQICLTPLNEWPTRNAEGNPGSCVETAETWVFTAAAPLEHPGVAPVQQSPDVTVLKDSAVIVRITADGTAPDEPNVRANRAKLMTDYSKVAVHYRSVLAPDTWPAALRFLDEPATGPTYRWDFGHRWSLEHAEAGSGWREAEWIYSPFRQTSVAWIEQPQASLIFPLTPAGGDYVLRMHVVNSDGIPPEKLAIKVNGTGVPVSWAAATDAVAKIPAGLLKDGTDALQFEAPVSKAWHLSFQVDWIELGPA